MNWKYKKKLISQASVSWQSAGKLCIPEGLCHGCCPMAMPLRGPKSEGISLFSEQNPFLVVLADLILCLGLECHVLHFSQNVKLALD